PDELWYGTANGFALGPQIAVNGIYAPVVGDFNGDGRADVLWYSLLAGFLGVGGGPSSVWLGRAGTAGFLHGPTIPTPPESTAGGSSDFNVTEYLPMVGDFNGDGRDDVYWSVVITTLPRLPANVVWYGAVNGFTVGTKSTAPIAVRQSFDEPPPPSAAT